MRSEKFAGACGAYVTGVDTSRPLSSAQIQTLKEALDEHLVVVLPGQQIDLDSLERFTDELGGRDVTPYVKPLDNRPYVIRVLKEETDELNFANAWHTDLSYLASPPAYTCLHAHQVPAFGGDTMWANQYLAYQSLSEHLKERLAGLTATHSAGMAYGTGGYLEAVAAKSSMQITPSQDAYATHEHPAVISHPRTKRKALFVNPVYTTGFVGLSARDSKALLAHLTTLAVHPNLTCRHRFKAHDLVIWDNFATQHIALNDYPGQRREMYRTSVKGSRPKS